MQYTRYDVEEFVREQDVKFVRLAFCDIFRGWEHKNQNYGCF